MADTSEKNAGKELKLASATKPNQLFKTFYSQFGSFAMPSLSSYVQKFSSLETRKGLEHPNCFWDGYWGRRRSAIGQFVFFPVPRDSPRSLCER